MSKSSTSFRSRPRPGPLARARLAWRRGKGLPFVTRALSTFGGLWGSPIFGSPANSGYAGGRLSRLSLDWVMLPLSANQEMRWNLRTLRARARELVRDNPHAKRFIHLCANNVIGHNGIRLQARVPTLKGEMSEGVNAQLEQEWEQWSHAESCSVDGRMSWTELQRMVFKTLPQDGEVLIRLIRGFPNAWGFALQLIDADQLDVTYNRGPDASGRRVVMGVELDRWDRPVVYHVWNHHPSEYEYEFERERVPIPADEIIHLFVQHRVGQARGVPWFHSVMMKLKMYDGYEEAELVAARTAAAKMGFIVMKNEEGYQPPPEDQRLQLEVEPGLMTQLDPGYEFQAWDPQHPTQAFEPFTKSVLKSVATGLGTTYAAMSGDLSEANYSSMRSGTLVERDEWKALQQWGIEHLHRRIYEAWLEMAILANRVTVGPRSPEKLKLVKWEPRGFEWVDPLSEMRAKALEIDYGLTSRRRQAAEQGDDLEEVFSELAQEEELAKENAITLAPMNVKPTAKAPTESNPAPAETAGEGATGGNGAGGAGGRAAVLEALDELHG